jgi:hypothetical protein
MLKMGGWMDSWVVGSTDLVAEAESVTSELGESCGIGGVTPGAKGVVGLEKEEEEELGWRRRCCWKAKAVGVRGAGGLDEDA